MLLYYPKNRFCTTMYIQDTTQSATEQQVRTGGRLLVYNTTHPFNGHLCGTTLVSQYQKGKKNVDFTDARDSEWQWYHLGHMQVCTLPRQITTSAPHHSPPNQQCQSTEGKV